MRRLRMKKNILGALVLVGALFGQAVHFSGRVNLSGASGIGVRPFSVLSLAHYSFTPGAATLSGYPQVTIGGTTYDQIGWQGGTCCPNGEAIYYPYQVIPTGQSGWTAAIHAGVAHGVMLEYNINAGASGFGTASNWTWWDMNAGLNWYGKSTSPGCVGGYQPPNNPTCLDTIGGYVDGVVVGTKIFPVPGPRSCPYCVLLMYDSSIGDITDAAAYQTFTPPLDGTTLGQYGWTGGCYDGTYVYYAPLSNPADGLVGNILRYDTLGTFGNYPGGGTPNAWLHYDISANVSSSAAGFFGCAYDGYRFVYYAPTQNTVVVRYDTWNGGLGPDGTGFQVKTNYAAIDITQLGSSGQPSYSGQGSAANLAGAHGGGRIVWDKAGANEYFYLIPWASAFTGDPVLSTTAVRVRVGTMSGANWTCADITGAGALGCSSAPSWEIYDLAYLQGNIAWKSTWAKTFTSGIFAGESTIGGFQLSWPTASGLIAFVPNSGEFFVEHDPSYHLYDPAGMVVGGPRVTGSPNAAFGGPYNSPAGCGMPATPGVPLYMYCGLH
jgi:hypothetical protein